MFNARTHICRLEGFVVHTHTAAICTPGTVGGRKTVSQSSLCQGTILDRILTNNVISHLANNFRDD